MKHNSSITFLLLFLSTDAVANLPIRYDLTTSDCEQASRRTLRFPERISEGRPSFWGIVWEDSASGIIRNRGPGTPWPSPRTLVDGNHIRVQMFMSYAHDVAAILPPSQIGCWSLPRLGAGRYRIRFEAHDVYRWPPFLPLVPAQDSMYDLPQYRADYVMETEIEVLAGPEPIPTGNPWTWALLGSALILSALPFRSRA